ncbi:MAG: PA2169 family four-helix-bundle protein [Cyclobacteriaceae bacterium]|jgi:uncharacterized protein (TIGR02284 family)|nr:PA2169 family four-helix-bundle protein [Cyclobacteriaceae bacterium]
MEKEKTVEALNTLMTINNDRVEGYETAANETEEADLKMLFGRFASTSQQCNRELATEVLKFGGEPAKGTMVSGKFFRVWMDVKAALTGKDRTAILSSCEYGEDAAKKTYATVLQDEATHLSNAQQTMIGAQQRLLEADHRHIKSLREASATA